MFMIVIFSSVFRLDYNISLFKHGRFKIRNMSNSISKNSNLLFLPKFSLKPDKIVYFNEVVRLPYVDSIMDDIALKNNNIDDDSSVLRVKRTITKNFHNFEISQSAAKKLREKISWLFQLGRSRIVKTYSGKTINNFKVNFITLTLPSVQIHPTYQITNECFNQFLTEIRSRLKMENYVWRLEFQQNGNVHYHIVTDTYIDYFFAQKIWNRIINKLGYVDDFQKKMSHLSLLDYHTKYGIPYGNDFSISIKRYAKGKREKWTNPHSVDVKNCTSDGHIQFYVSKYFSKSKTDACKSNILDDEQNSFSLRLWFCSRSLSKLTSIVEYVEAQTFCPKTLLESVQDVKVFYHQYANCFYFTWSKCSNYAKSVLAQIFFGYAKNQNYRSAGSLQFDTINSS